MRTVFLTDSRQSYRLSPPLNLWWISLKFCSSSTIKLAAGRSNINGHSAQELALSIFDQIFKAYVFIPEKSSLISNSSIDCGVCLSFRVIKPYRVNQRFRILPLAVEENIPKSGSPRASLRLCRNREDFGALRVFYDTRLCN